MRWCHCVLYYWYQVFLYCCFFMNGACNDRFLHLSIRRKGPMCVRDRPGTDIGKIDIFDFRAYVAVARKSSGIAYKSLREGNIKGRSFKVRKLS